MVLTFLLKFRRVQLEEEESWLCTILPSNEPSSSDRNLVVQDDDIGGLDGTGRAVSIRRGILTFEKTAAFIDTETVSKFSWPSDGVGHSSLGGRLGIYSRARRVECSIF